MTGQDNKLNAIGSIGDKHLEENLKKTLIEDKVVTNGLENVQLEDIKWDLFLTLEYTKEWRMSRHNRKLFLPSWENDFRTDRLWNKYFYNIFWYDKNNDALQIDPSVNDSVDIYNRSWLVNAKTKEYIADILWNEINIIIDWSIYKWPNKRPFSLYRSVDGETKFLSHIEDNTVHPWQDESGESIFDEKYFDDHNNLFIRQKWDPSNHYRILLPWDEKYYEPWDRKYRKNWNLFNRWSSLWSKNKLLYDKISWYEKKFWFILIDDQGIDKMIIPQTKEVVNVDDIVTVLKMSIYNHAEQNVLIVKRHGIVLYHFLQDEIIERSYS